MFLLLFAHLESQPDHLVFFSTSDAPVSARKNLVVVTNVQASRILWSSKKSKSGVSAQGVSFFPAGNATEITVNVTSKGKVVVSAGAIETPHLLELSGVGNSSILTSFGIPTIVDLPGVGENLQDHPTAKIIYELAPGLDSLDGLSTRPRNATKLAEVSFSLVRSHPLNHFAEISSLQALAEYGTGHGLLTQFVYGEPSFRSGCSIQPSLLLTFFRPAMSLQISRRFQLCKGNSFPSRSKSSIEALRRTEDCWRSPDFWSSACAFSATL